MADNRYYYFKDAKGNRHTVDKTAYDKDPMGFAKAFPGARMEVIDRKTGRRGDVSVKDASRVGDFGAHLFTGRTITRGKGKPNSSALGRAQQSVAQEKWGGGVVTHENTTASENVSAPKRNAVTLDDWNGGTTGKESELVKGLRAADMIRKRDEEQMPIDYTKPGAVKQMVGGARRAQKSLERRMEQAGQEAGRNAEGEIRRRNAPAFDLGNEDVNNNIVKTRGQLEDELEESAATIADKNFADTFANMIAGERQAAEKRGFDAYLQRTVFSATPMGSTLLGTIAYNAERDPAKLQQNLLNTLGKNMESMLSDPNVAQKVVTESKRLGVDPEDYVKTALMPSIQNKLMSEYDKTELKEWMPRNTFVDIIDGLGDGFQVGSILDAALTKAQRQYRQRAIMATQNGENPYYQRDKYGVTEGVRSALSLASDVIGPGGGVLGGIGKGVGAASAKVFGNEVKTIARMANMSKLQRMFKPSILMRGAAETGANFGIYEGLKGAQSYSSTTDDVKLGEMLENSAVSAAHGAVSGATLGVVGKMLGGLGYNVGIKGPMGVDPNFGKNMLKGLGMKGVQIIGEGTAFYAGGNFNNALSGADTDWSAGNLLSNIMAAGIYKIVSTHTATGAANMLTPEKGQSYGGSVAVKFGTALYKAAMAPSAQGKAFAFTPDEKQQLFASGDKAGLPGKEGSFGRQDILTWAERVMKATPVGKEDKSGNVKVAREYYESVMQDPNVSWDAKMKLNALLGIAPATRPEMDMRTYTIEDGKRYVNEYAKDGTLLSKRSYKNMEQREAIEYDLMMQKENQRMLNGLGYILNRDCSRMDLQMEFLRQHDYDFDNPDSPRNQAIMDDMLGNNKTLTLKRGRTLHDEWLDFVSENGITTKLIKDIADAHGLSVEEMFKIVNKEPIKRTEEEQRACVELRKALNNIVYEDGMPHADQADSDGKDVVEENNLGTENPNNEAVAEVLNNMNNAEKAFNAALESNDVLKQEYERLTKEGLSEPQIYMELINSGLTQEQLAPFADYINTKAKAVGMYRGTEQKIAETVQKHVEQWSYKGELNGEKQEGGQMLFVKDNNGRLLIVGAGDIAFDSEGRARENVGDMLSVLDPNTKEMDFVSKKDVQLDHVEKTEDYAKNYQEMLEVKNSVAYAQNEQQKQMENAAGGVSPEGGKPNGEEGVKHSYTLGEKKAGNGEPFYQDESGNIDLATIPDEVFEGIGYTKAPFRLTPSMIKHMLDRHNKELGFKDEGEAINFVVDVMNNFDHVRLGYDGALVFSIENGRKRTGKRAVTVLINSDNGEFYGLKTSGYEGIKGLEKRPLLWERGANETSSTDAASASVTTSKGPISGGQSGSASHQGNGLHDKDSNNSPNGNGNKETLTFADGSPVPMKKDSKGRETADYSQMTPEQGAEWIKTRFGENADSFVDGRIKRAEKAVNDAEKIKVDMSGEEEDVAKALAARKAAIESAEKELTYFTMVKNVMKQAKAAEAAAGGEGATGNRYEQWRKDGYHIGEGGVRYDRQKKEDMTGVYGKDVKVDFTPTVGVNGRAKVVEVDSVQASHVNGQVNPMHFGPDWQPKDRTDDASKAGQDKALANFDPEKITGDGNAFIGSSPSVNERHEVIQGNNRAEILRRLYDEQPEKAAQYKQWLIDHAEEYGLDAAEIAKMKKPILVNELPVDDAKALELGHYRASDFESGGKELPRTSVVINRLGDKMQSVANIMLSQGTLPDDAKMSDLVSQNASKVLDYLVKEGVVSATEEQTLRKDATAMRQWMEELLKTGLFDGDKQTEAAFNQLPDNARRAVLATYLRDAKSGDEAKIKRNLQRSFEAYNEMMNNPAFVNAKNVADARAAVAAEIERGNNSLLGEEPIRERFSNFELELAALYKGLKDQKTLTGLLNRYFDAVQGDKATGKQLEIGQEPREAISKDEAIKEVFGLQESKPAETQNQVDKAVKNIATEITKKTGIEVVTDEKEAEEVIRESEETDSDLKYHKETDEATLEELENGETVKVYRAMQVIDGKLYPPMAAAVNGKRVEANELGVWIRADENPDLAIPDIDPKTKEQKVDKKTGELKWKFKLDKGGKDATGKKATDIPAAYNPYWHTSRSPLNDQFKSAWIRPNIVVVECEVPVSELSSGYKAERAKDAVGEVDWKSGVVSGEVYKQTGRARKVILSRWCKPVRVLSDAEVAQRAKEFVGDAKVEIPENVLTPRQRIEFEKAGFKIGAPEKGVKKSDQINEALKRGLQIDNSVKEFRTKDGEVYGFTDGEKIYLDTRKMKPETPLHEYAHLWCDMLRRVNPKEWENVKKLFDKVEGLKEEVQKLYPELEGDALYEEMITTYSGREGTKKLEDVVRKLAAEEGKSVTESAKAQGFLEKVKEALTKYWKGVADVLGIHFTTAEEVADKVLADWAKGVDPREREKGKEKSEKSESVVTPKGDKKGDIKDATAPKGEKTKEEPSKTNPLAWLAHTAEMYKDEQVQKAKEELAKAKESGDASDIKRATADMKQKMETKLRGNGIGLVERRRIIGREIGKILGEEAGKAEAEKIDKPWEQMDLEEREAVSSKNPLTETEINELTSEENRELIPAALAYLRGDKGNIINAISYFKIWNDVRSRHENVPDNSGTKDGTQLDAPNTGGSQELGLGRRREGGGPDGPVDRTDGERTTPGERESGTGGENDTPVSTGKPRVDKGEGNTPGMDAVSAGSTDTRGGGGAGNEGNVPKRGGQGGGNGPLDPNAGRKPAAKQGTHFPDSTSERLKQERAEYEQKKKDFWERWKKAGQGYMKISLTPFKALNLSPEQIEMLPELFKMHLNGAVLKIKEGIYKFNEWKAAMRAEEGEELKMIGLSDDDIDRFIEDYWNTPYQMDGETHTIGEWAGIHGNEKLRNKLSEPLNDKYKRQVDAEPIKVKIGDKKNIEETLPYLLPQQQEDVLKAETQFFGNEHADREHAYGKGYMFTNGTGTGKTFTGLGIAKRLVKQGKGRILIVTPSQKKVSDWIKDGRNLNMEIRDLDSIAKERGTTATTESGEGVVITTFANFGVNKKLLEENWDAVIYDESHRIMENKKGTETARSMQHYMVTNRDENHCFLRLQEINKDYQKQKSLGEQFDIERAKETERIRKEYKASHPSATERDVAYATSRMVPRDVYNFTPSDYVTFPKLGKIHAEYVKALSHYTNEVKPKLEAQAKTEWKDTKTIFLSATPFNTRENLDYVEGYIFKYPEGEKAGRMSGRTQFYLDHFGAAYKFRYNRLEQSTSNPEAVAKQEIAFSDYLQDTLGTMSGRIIDSPYDYSRDFPTVSPDHAEQFNQAVQDAVRGHGVLADAYRRTIGDYNYGSALFETMKVANIIERIKAHLDAGRKVVIFHRRVETKEPLKPPFALMLEQANHLVSIMSEGKDKKEAAQAVRDFRKKYADLLKWEQTLDYSMPREQIAKVFGKDNVLFFSGKESSKVKDKAVDTFNDDDSGKNIIVIQEASGKEGISLHDTTGKHQRVCITLALPQSPITALQIEGRTYRIGNKSNAIFEYPILGLNSEMMLFGQKFNNQVSTTENLALGSQARSLRDSFANGILEHSGVVPIDQQGVGGKEFDAPKDQSTDGFDNAVLDYYSNQKLNSRNREGVDYFPTPEPLGYKMMEWANMGEGDTVMEPSAGHGAIARYAPKGNQMVAIEPSQSLFAKLQLKAGGLGRKFVNTIFENYDISNKHDVVVMNPPFGTAGATAIAHLGKAFKHLEEGGRVVAIIPRGSTDKKFEKWINGEKTAVMRAEVELPDIVFKQAGTNVVCRVVVVDKISNEAMRAKAGRVEKVSLGGHYDKIEDFFEDLRDIEMPDRIIDTNTIMQKKSKQTAKDLKELKDVTVNLNEHGINVHVRGDRNDYSIMFDLGEYNAEQRKSILSGTYERFEEYERYTRDETSQAVIAELKKLTCKLAGMTEEEMQRYLKKQNDGKGVMYRVEHAAEVYGKANAHYRMELGDTFSDSKEHFDAVRDRAVEEKGIVMPNLNKEKVKVVEVEKHLFGENKADAIKNARTWAKDNLATKNGDMPTMRDGTPYIISKAAIDKYLSNSAISKSDDPFVHLSVLKKLTDVIHESIEAEIHADYKKGEDGMRSVENGYGEGVLVHRLYGAVEIDGKMYRVKTTMQEFRGGEENKPHSYEVTKIELLDSPGKRENPDRPPLVSSSNSIDTAKLLQGVEKSYDSGKKLLDESKNLTDGETFFRKEGDGVVTPEKTSNAVSERIVKTVEKVAKRTGGKVKMVNSVEEIENPKVRKDIENGKQVTGWYDEKTGEVHLYMPNIHDTYTAEKTVWHETVGHKGMRGLLGDKFNDYMRSLWMDLDNPINAELRAYVKEKMNMNHLGFYDAIEEFIAKSAEDGKGEPGFWNYIKNKVTDALHEIGYRVSPNVKDVKYMLWLAKNVQKHGDSPLWKMRAEAVRWKIEHEKTEYTKIEGGELYDNDGKSHDFENMSREEWLEATDGEIHYRTAPSAATALDRYHHALDRHSYMATEAFMDNMLSLKKLMEAIDPSIRKIEDVNSSMNPYLMQNITEGKMSDKSKLFEIRYMDPLSKAMSSVLDSFDGKKVEDRIRNFNLYMIRKHGLERNRVLFVRDWIREERKVKSEESDSIDALETAWKDERSDLRQKLDSGQIDLKEYYRQMDEWIVQNLDKDFKAEEHDYSGMHGLQGIADKKAAYDDAGAIDEVMSQEASMESMKKGSVADFWKKVKAATDYSVNSYYESGQISQITHDGVLGMFDWYVPLRKFDEATAEDVYGYVTEMGDPSNYIGTTLMNAKGRKSLSNVEILAQIGLMGNRAIRNGGQNTIKQAFARFVRNSGEQNLVKETKVWVEKTGTDLNGNDIWEEAYPQIPEGASADDVASIVDAFETDMRAKQAKGEAKSLSNGTDIGFKFQRAKDKSQHFVDVKIAGRTHRFVVLGNPRAAQALNGMLENGKARSKTLQTMCRFMAMASTSWSPEFVNRNSLKDFELSSAHVLAKEGGRYAAKWVRYYGELNPLNMFHNEGAGALKSMKWKDLKNGVGFGLYARYREGTLGSSKMERYFKEFMENGGETGFVQLFSMHDMEKSYKSIVENETAKNAKGLSVKKIKVNFVEVLKQVGKDIEALNEVAENMARFATYCTSRDFGRSAARSAYDAKEVSSNFNRHGSGYGVLSFKNGEMSGLKKAEQKLYGGLSGWLKNYSMFFNAGVQSTSLLFKNIKHAPVSTGLAMMTSPFVLGLLFTLINNYKIQNEDEKDRGKVKDPYGELPEYIRRNNICYYVGKGSFVTVPLAIELRAFYGLGDLAAGYTFAKNVESQRNWAWDAVGCMSQLFPVVDFLNNPNFEKSVPKGAGMIGKAVAPTAVVPIIEWCLNNDWKGAPIRRTGDKADLNPAWQNAYSNVPARLIDLNKWVNAKTNDVAPGNAEMKGNEALDMLTNPSGLSHFYDSYSSGFGTFIQRTAGLGVKVATGKTDEIEVGDVPFLRSLFYTPREQSSMARTKAKWYNYKEEMEQTIANNDKLKSKNVPTMKRIENAAALEKFEGSAEQRKVNIIKNAEKRMRHWNTMRKKWADDKKQVDFANKNIEMIMQEAVEDLDRIE
jgi:predicted RNA methylase